MPIYEYRCEKGHTFDVMQRMADEPLISCEQCAAPVVRVLHAPAVHFKGSGFYNTDYGTKKRAREKSAESKSGKSGEGKSSGDGGGESKSTSDSGSSSSDSKSDGGSKRPRARLRSAALAALLLATVAAAPAAASGRFVGQVTDALRTPTHRLVAGASGRAAADLVFVDHQRAGTSVRSCVHRTDVAGVRTCFTDATGPARSATVTPLRFPRGRYVVRWSVGGVVVARWRFVVV